MRKISANQQKILKIDTFSGGGGRQLYGQNDLMDIRAFMIPLGMAVALLPEL